VNFTKSETEILRWLLRMGLSAMKGYWKKDKVQQAQSLVDRIDDEIKQCGIYAEE
jgi:hypothetical protein